MAEALSGPPLQQPRVWSDLGLEVGRAASALATPKNLDTPGRTCPARKLVRAALAWYDMRRRARQRACIKRSTLGGLESRWDACW